MEWKKIRKYKDVLKFLYCQMEEISKVKEEKAQVEKQIDIETK